MNDTLFPEYFIEELRQTAGILSGPLKIAGQIILRPDFEKIEVSIKNDQLHLSESRALSRNCGFQNSGGQKHPSVQLVVAFFIEPVIFMTIVMANEVIACSVRIVHYRVL